MFRESQARRQFVTELKEEQNQRQTPIDPSELPFDLTSELGKISEAAEISPGVYSLLAKKEDISVSGEYYVVTADAPAISEEARSYGRKYDAHPDLCVYDQLEPNSGRRIIDFEVRRYQIKHHLPVIVNVEDELYSIAIYGMEENPEYFGTYPVPMITPRGCTVRHKTIINGVYWLETERCEKILAVAYPIWQADITIPEQNLGEQLDADRMQGIDHTLGYLFFPEKDCAIPLHELCMLYPQIEESGMIDRAALLNFMYEAFPEYAEIQNAEERRLNGKNLIETTPGIGTEFIRF